MRKVLVAGGVALVVCLGLTAGLPAAAGSAVSGSGVAGSVVAGSVVAGSVEVTIRSDIGWQPASLDLKAGQAFTVEYRSGTWTVGYPGLARVGIDGYDAAADAQIYQGCKILTDQTYGHLLARTGGGAPFVIARSGTFTAPEAGPLELRINDDDRCLGDNAGAIDLRVSADAGAATAPTATPAAAPTAVPGSGTAGAPANGLKLYSADWSSGFNGWAGDSSWNTLRGRLVTDGNSWASTIYAPYDTGALHDYAVEARIRAINGARFGVLLRHSADGRGYIAMVDGGSAWLGIGPDAYLPAGIGDGHGFGPGSDWHTYRIEADGNEMRFLIDGAQYATATDNRYLSGGVSGISAQQSQIEVADFAVLKLH